MGGVGESEEGLWGDRAQGTGNSVGGHGDGGEWGQEESWAMRGTCGDGGDMEGQEGTRGNGWDKEEKEGTWRDRRGHGGQSRRRYGGTGWEWGQEGMWRDRRRHRGQEGT